MTILGCLIIFYSKYFVIFQIKPVKGRYVFDEPINEHFSPFHHVEPLWRKFEPFELVYNHRQGEGSKWTDILNRIRIAAHTEEDVKVLKTRITTDPILEFDATHIMYTNREVTDHNNKMLNLLPGEAIMIKAIKKPNTYCVIKPDTGNVDTTSMKDELTLKVDAKVQLVYNINTVDGLVNGAVGHVVGYERNSSGEIYAIMVEFEDKNTGQQQRSDNLRIVEKYSNRIATPIFKHTQEYDKSKGRGTIKAKVIQFPMSLAWAITSHRVQVTENF